MLSNCLQFGENSSATSNLRETTDEATSISLANDPEQDDRGVHQGRSEQATLIGTVELSFTSSTRQHSWTLNPPEVATLI